MLALDTNIIVRDLTDDPEQFAKARALIDGEDVYVWTTVLLETEWVLRRGYRFGRSNHRCSDRLRGTSAHHIGGPWLARKALEWTRSGLDFAEALHLVKAGDCEAFVSLDQRFAPVANALGGVKVRAP